MQKVTEIFIANTAEAFADLLELETSEKLAQQERIEHETDLSQRAQFWGGDNKVVITPYAIPSVLLESVRHRLGYTNVTNLWPTKSGLRLCSAISSDAVLIDSLVEIIRANPGMRISSYAVTTEYADLLRLFKKRADDCYAVNMPLVQDPVQLVRTFDSKNGFREITADLFSIGDVRIPRGFICKTEAEVLKAILEFRVGNRGFVVKVHNGESGWGVKIVDDDTVQKLEHADMGAWLGDLFRSDPIWEFAPYIVEEFVSVDTSVGGGFPSGEGHITERGFVFDYNCGQGVTSEGVFEGVAIGTGVLPDAVDERITRAMEKIGSKYYASGYRGTFDIDFVAAAGGDLYAIECNARMTGGSHVYGVMSHLKLNMRESCILSDDALCYGIVARKPEKILTLLSDLLYPIQKEKRGVIVSFINEKRPVIGVIAIGENRADARFLISKVRDSLEVSQVIN